MRRGFNAAKAPTKQTAEDPAEQGTAAKIRNWGPRHDDPRDRLDRRGEISELPRLEGVCRDLEIGAVAEMIHPNKPDNPPAILFEKILSYPHFFMVLPVVIKSSHRLSMTLGSDEPRQLVVRP